MMRTIGRVLGWLLLAAGLVAGGLDVWNSIQEEELSLIPLGQHWFEISTSSLNAAQGQFRNQGGLVLVVFARQRPPLREEGGERFFNQKPRALPPLGLQ